MSQNNETSAPRQTENKKGFLGWIKNLKGNKRAEIIIAVALIAVILIVYFVGFYDFGGSSGKDDYTASASEYCAETEAKLTAALKKVGGVKDAVVIITFDGSVEYVIAYTESTTKNSNMTKDGAYTENTTSTQTPITAGSSGNQAPIILKEVYPKVTGVAAVVKGSGGAALKLEITQLITVLLSVPASKVYVSVS